MSIGENKKDAIINRIVASRTGVRVTSTIEAATKLRPQTMATEKAANVPLLIDWVVINCSVYVIRIYHF